MGRGKSVRYKSMKALRNKILLSKKYKNSEWKLLNYPEIFKRINEFPYIVRRDDKRYV